MKAVASSTYVMIPPVRLYREDIDDLLGILGPGSRVDLVHRDYSYDSLDELADRVPGRLVRTLRVAISRTDPYGSISMHFERDGVRIMAGSENSAPAALVAEKLRQRVPWYSWRPVGYWWMGVHGILGFLLAILVSNTLMGVPGVPDVIRIPLGAIAGGALGVAALSDASWMGSTILFLDPRARQITFWQRNGDKILVGVITSALSGLGGYLLGRFLPR
jgi:hypothetical protein